MYYFVSSFSVSLGCYCFSCQKSENFLGFLSTILKNLAKSCEPCQEYLPRSWQEMSRIREISWQENLDTKHWDSNSITTELPRVIISIQFSVRNWLASSGHWWNFLDVPWEICLVWIMHKTVKATSGQWFYWPNCKFYSRQYKIVDCGH